MKYFTLLMMFCALGMVAFIYNESRNVQPQSLPQKVEATLPGGAHTVRLATMQRTISVEHEAPTENVPSAPDFREQEEVRPLEGADCLFYGPLERAKLTVLRKRLEKTGLLDRMLIERDDRVLRLVYVGPYSTRKLAEKTYKKLTQEGLHKGEVIPLHEGTWGICIAQTRSRAIANHWARKAAQYWSLTNVVVSDIADTSNQVRLVFPGLSAEESVLIRKALGSIHEATFSACPQ